MRRPHPQLTHEVLVEETRFVLRTLQRDDLFGEQVRLVEAERVLDGHITLAFNDYCNFLNKFGYVRVDPIAKVVEVTAGGTRASEVLDDAELIGRVSRHFAKELSGSIAPSSSTVPPPTPPPPRSEVATTMEPMPVRTSRPASTGFERVATSASGLDDVLDRRYRRGDMLGQGTVGTVYQGEHVTLGRKVAIKEARGVFQFASYLRRDEIVERLKTVMQSHAALEHPGILQILDQNTEREYPYFVLQLATGGNLRDRLQAAPDGRLDLPIAVRVLLQISYALKFAHEHDVLHTGLKPENVLFDGQGNVKLSDFGFTKITERSDQGGSHTPVLVGSNAVGYLPPERIQPGEAKPFTPAADVYALGLMFYEMITGKLPGRRSPLPSEVRKEVPAAFDDVFDKMTRDELEERYATVDEVLDGIYKAFPDAEVFNKGSILFWAEDPTPLPEPEPEDAPEPEAVASVEAEDAAE